MHTVRMDINSAPTIKLDTPVHDTLQVPLHISDFGREAARVAARQAEADALLTDEDMSAMYAAAMVAQ